MAYFLDIGDEDEATYSEILVMKIVFSFLIVSNHGDNNNIIF